MKTWLTVAVPLSIPNLINSLSLQGYLIVLFHGSATFSLEVFFFFLAQVLCALQNSEYFKGRVYIYAFAYPFATLQSTTK